ncbi:MAG: Rossmann-like and DUF2520 domain-containing protein [Desulfobacterales bacterium]
MKPTIAIVGCGKVGTTLAIWLSRAGYAITGLASNGPVSAKNAAALTATDHYGQTNWEMTLEADIVFITTPDGIISDVCDAISQRKGFKKDAVILHCSGAHASTILSSAKDCGAMIGSMHPLQSIASIKSESNPFEGIIVSVEGEDRAVETARQIATDLGATSYTIRTEAKMLYHAAAVVASNYLVALLGLSFKLIGKAGIPDTDAYSVLQPLIGGTLGNIEKVGIPAALTGPISRGDVDTVAQHIEAMKAQTPELLSLYRTLGTATIDIARAAGTLSEEGAGKLRDVLKDQ